MSDHGRQFTSVLQPARDTGMRIDIYQADDRELSAHSVLAQGQQLHAVEGRAGELFGATAWHDAAPLQLSLTHPNLVNSVIGDGSPDSTLPMGSIYATAGVPGHGGAALPLPAFGLTQAELTSGGLPESSGESNTNFQNGDVRGGNTVNNFSNGTNGAGRDGKDGQNGRDGKDGHDGKDGKDCKDGKDGYHGEKGRDGKDGKDGHDGRDGDDCRPGRGDGHHGHDHHGHGQGHSHEQNCHAGDCDGNLINVTLDPTIVIDPGINLDVGGITGEITQVVAGDILPQVLATGGALVADVTGLVGGLLQSGGDLVGELAHDVRHESSEGAEHVVSALSGATGILAGVTDGDCLAATACGVAEAAHQVGDQAAGLVSGIPDAACGVVAEAYQTGGGIGGLAQGGLSLAHETGGQAVSLAYNAGGALAGVAGGLTGNVDSLVQHLAGGVQHGAGELMVAAHQAGMSIGGLVGGLVSGAEHAGSVIGGVVGGAQAAASGVLPALADAGASLGGAAHGASGSLHTAAGAGSWLGAIDASAGGSGGVTLAGGLPVDPSHLLGAAGHAAHGILG